MSCKVTMAALALLSIAGSSYAGPEWVEGGPEGVLGDAGSLPGNSQSTSGVGGLSAIMGSLEGSGGGAANGDSDFEDMYLFAITEPGMWYASTLPEDGGFAEFNPSLWLFDVGGLGLLGNEFFFEIGLVSGGGIGFGGPAGKIFNFGDAKLTNASDDGVTVIDQPGLYLIAITENGNVPFSEGGPIFDFSFDNEVSGNDGPGGNLPITVWSNNLQTGEQTMGTPVPGPAATSTPSASTGGPGDYVIRFFGSGFAEGDVIELPVDVKPGTCNNPFNPSSNGVTPVGLLGTADADGHDVDLSSVVISRADGVGGTVSPNEGPPGPSSKVEHVGSPGGGSDPCDCDSGDDDEYVDVKFKFPSAAMSDVLELDELPGGTVVEIVVSGELHDGTPFEGHGCLQLVPLGGLAAPPPGVTMTSNAALTWIDASAFDFWYDDGGFPPFVRHWDVEQSIELVADPVPGRQFLGWRLNGSPVILPLPIITIDANTVESVEAVYTLPFSIN